MNPYSELVFWVGKIEARQDVCSWFRDFSGEVVICRIRFNAEMLPLPTFSL